jgi:membrane protease YdiL (CAAX protease family)
LILVVVARIVDIFFLPLAQATGEAILHKALGFALVVVYVWAVGQPLAAIGLHSRALGRALFIGASGVILVLALAFGVQWLVLRAGGDEATLVVQAIDSMTGLVRPELTFALYLVVGNFVNSFMEEGLFRGIMLTHFRVRLSPWRANLLQAILFGLWHLTWPIWRLIHGQADLATTASQGLFVVIGASVTGLAYGYLYLKTDSLWASWIAHTINNTTLNVLHFRTAGGLDANVVILQAVLGLGYLALLLWTKMWARRLRMPELRPWGSATRPEWAD